MDEAILVVGFGNPLMGDDGVGHVVATELAAAPSSSGLRVRRCHGDGLRLAGIWKGEKHVWIIDAALRGADPGTLEVFDHDQLMCLGSQGVSAHHLNLTDCLRLLHLVTPRMHEVRFRLFTVEALSLEPKEGLSARVARAVPETVKTIRREAQKQISNSRYFCIFPPQ